MGAMGTMGSMGGQGLPGATGPAGPTGPVGPIDYSRVIMNGTIAQQASFHISGMGVIGGAAQVTGGTNPFNLTDHWTSSPDGVTDVAEIANDTATYQTLMIAGNRSGGIAGSGPNGIDRRVSIWDRLEVNGTLQVNEASGTTAYLGATGCGSGTFAGLGLHGAMSACTNYSVLGDATDLYLNRPGGAIHFRTNNAEQMTIASNGAVSIQGALTVNASNASACGLIIDDDTCLKDDQNGSLNVHTANGAAWAGVNALAFNAQSSIALKKDVTPLGARDYARMLDALDALPLYTYRYNEEAPSRALHTGLIAEHTPPALTAPSGKAIDLYAFASLEAGATKALYDRTLKLERENAELKARLARVERLLEARQ
jgi:hypothetical protein